jgi:pseudo-rSAM protein
MEIDRTQDYWFLLPSHTCTSFAENSILLYNTNSGLYVESTKQEAVKLIQAAQEKKNLGACFLSRTQMEDQFLSDFIMQTIVTDTGRIIPVKECPEKPISLLPVLNIQQDVEKLKKDSSRSVGEGVLSYLTTLNLFVNTSCEQECAFCHSYYKQILCCTKQAEIKEMPISTVAAIITQIEASAVGKINILGGNILKYGKIKSLIKLLENIHSSVYYWLFYKNITFIEQLKPLGKKNIIINFPIDTDRLNRLIKETDPQKTTFYFIVENADQYEKIELLLANCAELKYKISPFYNGQNIDFFEEFIFLSKEDLFLSPTSQRTIFCNQAINANHFGELYIFPNGTVKANSVSCELGNIYQSSIIELLTFEMEQNTVWRKFRNTVPCSNCLYQYICPPPSNYEIAIGKPNLCHVKP